MERNEVVIGLVKYISECSYDFVNEGAQILYLFAL